jgi:hypothetical protein
MNRKEVWHFYTNENNSGISLNRNLDNRLETDRSLKSLENCLLQLPIVFIGSIVVGKLKYLNDFFKIILASCFGIDNSQERRCAAYEAEYHYQREYAPIFTHNE